MSNNCKTTGRGCLMFIRSLISNPDFKFKDLTPFRFYPIQVGADPKSIQVYTSIFNPRNSRNNATPPMGINMKQPRAKKTARTKDPIISAISPPQVFLAGKSGNQNEPGSSASSLIKISLLVQGIDFLLLNICHHFFSSAGMQS